MMKTLKVRRAGKILALFRGDLKNISRDSMLIFILLSPLLLGLGFKLLLPWITVILKEQLDFNLTEHYPFIMAFIIMLIPLMQGMMIGFMILEDRDQGILSYYAVTPLSRSHYLAYRLVLPVILSIFFSIFIIYFLQIAAVSLLKAVPVVLMAALEAPLMAVFIAAFADNKVEGFAFSKGAGVLFAALLGGYLLRTDWKLLIGIFPTYWVSEAYLAAYRGLTAYLFYLLPGITIHIVLIILLLKRFQARIN